MKRMHHLGLGLALLAAGALIAACGEKPQTNAQGVKHDATPWSGSASDASAQQRPEGGTPFTADGWKAGDKSSWEQHMKTRAQNGQNEYSRIN